MAKVQNFKLGSKSSLFYDMTTGIKMLPGEVIKVEVKDQLSKKFQRALKGGAIEVTDEELFKRGQKAEEVKEETDNNTEDLEEDSEEETGKTGSSKKKKKNR